MPPTKIKGRGLKPSPLPQHPRFRRLWICCTTMKRLLSLNQETLFPFMFPLLSILIFFSLLSLSLTPVSDWCDYHDLCCFHWHHHPSLPLSLSLSSSLGTLRSDNGDVRCEVYFSTMFSYSKLFCDYTKSPRYWKEGNLCWSWREGTAQRQTEML